MSFYMQKTSESSVTSPQDLRSPSVQWIGVQWRGGFYALLLSGVTAVFKANSTKQAQLSPDLDIEIHDGEPVFMRSFNQCFELGKLPELSLDEEFRWALIVNGPGASPLGCRVNQVVGPFWSDWKSAVVHHEGHDWLLVHPYGGIHA